MTDCPHCGKAVFKSRDGETAVARTTYLALHKSTGAVEIRCDHCKGGIVLPLVVDGTELRKAKPRRKHVVRKA